MSDLLSMLGGGLLWNPIKHATGLTDAQMAGLGAAAIAAPFALPTMFGSGAAAGAAGAADAGASLAAPMSLGSVAPESIAPMTGGMGGMGVSAPPSAGLLDTFNTYAKPIGNALQMAQTAKGLLPPRPQPMQAPQLGGGQGTDFSSLIQANNSQLAGLQQRRMQRQGLLGGGYGGIA